MSPLPIRWPRWCQPAHVSPGHSFRIDVDPPPPPGFSLALVRGDERMALGVAHDDAVPSCPPSLDVTVPHSCPVGLWDLRLESTGMRHSIPHAVVVQDAELREVRIACMGDWHLIPAACDGPDAATLDLYSRLVTRLNTLAPDCVIHVGDVITRYQQPALAARSDHLLRWQCERAGEILAGLDVPLFVLTGNHDSAYPACRAAWRDVFGRATRGETDDHACVIGPCQLIMLDGFAHYDPHTLAMTTSSLTDEQVRWMEAQCSDAGGASHRVLVLHYDYASQVLPRLGELGIDAFVYGHTKAVDTHWFSGPGVEAQDVNVPGSAAYRLITATRTALRVDPPVALDEL